MCVCVTVGKHMKRGESLAHTSGGRGYRSRGKWIRDEKFVSGRGECVCEAIGAPSRLIRKAMWPLWDVKTELFIEMSRSKC